MGSGDNQDREVLSFSDQGGVLFATTSPDPGPGERLTPGAIFLSSHQT